ncbi:hypothetical protein AZI86_13025 [Bdellovibrio bacteriovorus]|uniref:Uncharacterized protein n=1 Tax=Bdellovibrio bacteriovorus TaxID=959 RepID=A0A150WJP1_BDEBC|nr:hypothetical protein [Bdellovibrio bacteriovorus]KYG63741.1 hypothetical protein AZI86_13025 [Bdellovibrio bacteriovorus]
MVKKIGAIGIAVAAAFFLFFKHKTTTSSDIVELNIKRGVSKTEVVVAATPRKTTENKKDFVEDAKSLSSIVKDLSASQYSKHVPGDSEELKLKMKLQKMSSKDWNELAISAIDPATSFADKRSVIYLLKLAGPEAISAMKLIAQSPFVEPVSEHSVPVDRALRLASLEYLDILAGNHAQAGRAISEVSQKLQDPQLRFFAQISFQGISEGSPGRLHRLLSASIQEEVEGL